MLCQSLLYSKVTQLYTYTLSLFIYNFVYLFLAMLGLHCCVGIFYSCKEQGMLSRGGAWAFHCGDYTCYGAQALGCTGFSSCGTWHQQLWLPSSRAQAQQLWSTGLLVCSTWCPSESGVKLVSPLLAGRLFTTEPPGKPYTFFLIYFFFNIKVLLRYNSRAIQFTHLKCIFNQYSGKIMQPSSQSILVHFYHVKKKPHYHEQSRPIFSLPHPAPGLGNYLSTFCLYRFAKSGH